MRTESLHLLVLPGAETHELSLRPYASYHPWSHAMLMSGQMGRPRLVRPSRSLLISSCWLLSESLLQLASLLLKQANLSNDLCIGQAQQLLLAADHLYLLHHELRHSLNVWLPFLCEKLAMGLDQRLL